MITLRKAGPKDETLYKNLFNLYQNDLSVFYTDGTFSRVDANGYFDADTVREIFPPDASILPFVIEDDRHIIGLLLITRPPYAEHDYCVEELYLVRAQRGKGKAEAAVESFFRTHPGVYTLEVFRENAPAVRFWQKLIAGKGRLLARAPGREDMDKLTFKIE